MIIGGITVEWSGVVVRLASGYLALLHPPQLLLFPLDSLLL